MIYVEIFCIFVVLSIWPLNRWKGLPNVNRNVRRTYYVILSIVCILVATDITAECIDRIINKPFSIRTIAKILAGTGWWLISWAIVFRRVTLTKKLWE